MGCRVYGVGCRVKAGLEAVDVDPGDGRLAFRVAARLVHRACRYTCDAVGFSVVGFGVFFSFGLRFVYLCVCLFGLGFGG